MVWAASAVAVVYDTLTVQDTYRDRMTPFQAITELRRVAGRQLDRRFVEVLTTLLTGRADGLSQCRSRGLRLRACGLP